MLGNFKKYLNLTKIKSVVPKPTNYTNIITLFDISYIDPALPTISTPEAMYSTSC